MHGRRSMVIALAAIWAVVATATAAMAQASPEPLPAIGMRLPGAIDGSPVQVVISEDLDGWLEAVFAGESYPEIEALETALDGQGLALADVPAVTAVFGTDAVGQIQGFGIPTDAPATLDDTIVAAYLIGLGPLERTERDVGGRSVTFLSEGPLDTADYPFAVLPDAGVVWIVSAELEGIIDAIEALIAVSNGEAPGNTGLAPSPPAAIGPDTWFGTMRQTLTWDKGAYVGGTTATFEGTWERIKDEDIDYCPAGTCAAYRPMGEIAWTFESVAPGPPGCRNHQSGSVSAGDVVIPQDQMLFLAPADADHWRYWGTGTIRVPPQDCLGWEGISAPGLFFDLPLMDDEDTPFADLSNDPRPSCGSYDWRIARDATQLTGSCWRYDESGYEQRFEWDLRDVDPT